MSITRRDELIYFKRKFNAYTAIGVVDTVRNTLFLNGHKNAPVNAILKVTKIYAYKKLPSFIPSTHQKYKKFLIKEGVNAASILPPQELKTFLGNNLPSTNEAINKQKQHFLMEISAQLFREEKNNDGTHLSPIELYHVALTGTFSRMYEDTGLRSEGAFCRYLNNLWQEFIAQENYIPLPQYKFEDNFLSIFAIHRPLRENTGTPLNEINYAISFYLKRQNPLTDLMSSFLESYLEHLKQERIIKICPNCKQAFAFKESKKYCSYRCKKSIGNKKHYAKNPASPSKLKKVQEYRSFLKEKGINKKHTPLKQPPSS